MKRFEQKVAIVTGGAQGIGEAIVRLLAREGATVVVADVDAANGEALANELGDTVRFQPTDVSSEDQVAAAVDVAASTFGGLDIMVNNAGIVGADPSVMDVTIEQYRAVTDVLLLGVLLGTKHAARAMVGRSGGAIVNIASIAGLRGGLGPQLYTTSKHAVIGLTRATATELVSHDIRVNAVAPGGVATPMGARHVLGDASQVEALAASIASRSPLSRGSTPFDIAEAVAYLASDASGYVSGQVLTVDAGAVMAPPRTPTGGGSNWVSTTKS